MKGDEIKTDNDNNDGALIQEVETRKHGFLKYNSNSSNEKSEKYDEMMDIPSERNEKIETMVKRVSAENGSLITQTSLNSLVKRTNLLKLNEDKSNSFEWLCSKSISSNLSNSQAQNYSGTLNDHRHHKKFNNDKRVSESTKANNDNNLNYESYDEIPIRPTDRNLHLNNKIHPNKYSDYLPNRVSNSTNNSHDYSQDSNIYLINLDPHTQRLPKNSAMLDCNIDKIFTDAFSLNRVGGNRYGSKRSSKIVNNDDSLLNYIKKNEIHANFNERINNLDTKHKIFNHSTYINSSNNINVNNSSHTTIPTIQNAKTNSTGSFINKNSNSSSPFYINLNNYLYYNDEIKLLDNINTLLQEQTGCRFVQTKIEEKNKIKDIVFLGKFFEKIKDNILNIINDQFGNYVVQKFFEGIILDTFLLSKFFQTIKDHLFAISIHPFGTRFFQKSLENLSSFYSKIENVVVNDVLKELILNNSYNLIIDTNGNHVFQKILIMYPKDKNQFIYDELNKISVEVAKIKQGGCIFQRAFDIASFDQKRFLIREIINNINLLINDEYGNFIIQSVIYLKIKDVNNTIFEFLKERLLDLSKKKFSSNVIDKVRTEKIKF